MASKPSRSRTTLTEVTETTKKEIYKLKLTEFLPRKND
jgi:hypothetical protein